MEIGKKYNWIGQPERLIYIGRQYKANGRMGYWHQFEKVDDPGVIWCEVADHDLNRLEETQEEQK